MDDKDILLRKGKWTAEEENYANMIITLFNQGMLPILTGTTLRSYLSDKLRWYSCCCCYCCCIYYLFIIFIVLIISLTYTYIILS